MPDFHLKFGGSTAERTINCPGWHVQSEALPRPPESDAARQGTMLHGVVEKCLLEDATYVPEPAGDLTEELLETKVMPALDAWDELCERYSIEEFEPEVRVTMFDDTGGTADIIAAGGTDTVLVVDWKFGDGVIVDAEDSHQGLFYALCGSRTREVNDLFDGRTKLVIAIIQPTSRSDEVLKVWETTWEEMRSFEGQFMTAREKALSATVDDDDALSAGTWCRFCPAQAVCPLKTGLVDERRRLPIDSLHAGTLSQALDVADEIETWIAAVRKMAHEQMEQGVKIDDWKLVHKRAYRQYTDEAAVENIVKRSRKLKAEETHKSTLLTPAQLEKVYKAKGLDFTVVEEHIAKVSSGTTIARASDKRPEAPAIGALRALAARTAA